MIIKRGYFGVLYYVPKYGFAHHCPGCKGTHVIPFDRDENGPTWEFNFDAASPHFTPSLRHTWGRTDKGTDKCCHYNIEHGEIYFHGDSTHSLAGQRMALEEMSPTEKQFWENALNDDGS